ncbi:MAG: hypothetical protein JWM09_1210 [Francisellaceae bacterium]|nr:hypothetical protein [Francisellaceae bacterium]
MPKLEDKSFEQMAIEKCLNAYKDSKVSRDPVLKEAILHTFIESMASLMTSEKEQNRAAILAENAQKLKKEIKKSGITDITRPELVTQIGKNLVQQEIRKRDLYLKTIEKLEKQIAQFENKSPDKKHGNSPK